MRAVRDAGGDEVDGVVAAWRRERPDLDVAPMEVLSRVSRLARHLDRLRAMAFAAHRLESWEFDVLAALRRAGQPYELNPGELSRQTMVTSGTMTNRVDRLTRRGLVVREDAPGDRRAVRVCLTDAGRLAVDAALADLLIAEREMVAELPSAEQALVAGGLRQLLESIEPGRAAS